ncbi:glycosyltransferase [Segnochrobactrum spirostomi]|uniref:Glycosyltransferase family 1 protein n=1 Tax=Segnochrobactrum spirostomi TaxID=2608987 RepID=A0A6A7Y3Q9_9HYPH|nr:glycosyltransferase [Segnochrobactrum spirostomi]MQT12372.1 glycosyltransferase family 1 protein [Segnochrobactrum spirostomi]
MRIVFATLGSLGDLHPMLALAKASRERGHHPVIAAPETHGDYVISHGFEFHPIRPDFSADTLIFLFTDPRHGGERLMREVIFANARETYTDLLEATRGADFLVVGELVYVGQLVARTLGIPWANAMLSPETMFSAYDPSIMPARPEVFPLRRLGAWTHKAIYALARRRTQRWETPVEELQRELGDPNPKELVFGAKFSPHLVLVLFPAFIAAPQPDWPKAAVQTGFPFFHQPHESDTAERIAAFVAAGDPPIVFTLGSTAVYLANDFYDLAATAARKLGRRAILLKGKNKLTVPPGEDILSLDYAPHELVFPHACVIAHHGGIGGCAEVLRSGVPGLVVPFGADQPDNALRLTERGVALTLARGRISEAGLVEKLGAILDDPQMAARARAVAKGIRPEEDMRHSIEAIERVTSASAAEGPRRT